MTLRRPAAMRRAIDERREATRHRRSYRATTALVERYTIYDRDTAAFSPLSKERFASNTRIGSTISG